MLIEIEEGRYSLLRSRKEKVTFEEALERVCDWTHDTSDQLKEMELETRRTKEVIFKLTSLLVKNGILDPIDVLDSVSEYSNCRLFFDGINLKDIRNKRHE